MMFLLGLGCLWALPTSLIGLLFALLGGTKFRAFRDGVCCFLVKPHWLIARIFGNQWAAITFGNVQVYGTEAFFSDAKIRKHEGRHTVQAYWLGPFFLLAYGLASLVSWAEGKGFYEGNWFEADARAWAERP